METATPHRLQGWRCDAVAAPCSMLIKEGTQDMKIAILGSGHIGGNLGKLWAKAGHEVFFGSRNPDNLAGLLEAIGPNAHAGTVDEALAFSDIVVDALPFGVTMDLPADKLAGNTLITASNYYPARDGTIDLEGLSHSEAVARRLPDTMVVKAFNMLYFKELEDRLAGGGTKDATVIIAGDNEEAKTHVAELVRDAQLDVVDAGPLAAGRWFETDAPLYNKRLSAAEVRAQLATLSGRSQD